jgi:hypothetical protein
VAWRKAADDCGMDHNSAQLFCWLVIRGTGRLDLFRRMKRVSPRRLDFGFQEACITGRTRHEERLVKTMRRPRSRGGNLMIRAGGLGFIY